MADFCTRCHKEMGFRGDPDIDLVKESQTLELGHYTSPAFLCEGCGHITLFNIDGVIRVDSGLDLEVAIDPTKSPTLEEFLGTPMPEI